MEEAPITIKVGLDRDPVGKGFVQTYFIHIRNLLLLYKEFGFMRLTAFHVFFIFGSITAVGVLFSLFCFLY